MTLELFLIACEMRVDGLTATAQRGMGKSAQCGMLTRGQWDGPEICMAKHFSNSQKFTIISLYNFTIICIIYYYFYSLLLFLMFTIISIILFS